MKISYNWLKDYIETDKTAEEIAVLLTDCGLEVESIEKYESLKGGLEGVVVGEVITKTKHPDADKLSLTKVNIGDNKVLDIVCGAPNVEAGQKVLVATTGSTLHKFDAATNKEVVLKINKSKIRGAVSEGMICAEDELGLGTSHAGIMVLDSLAIPGTLAKDYLKLYEDTVFEIGLTPNRSDATSHIGVARDLFAVLKVQSLKLGETLHATSVQSSVLRIPSVNEFKVDKNDRKIEVSVPDTAGCIRYTGIEISGFKIKESPEWLKNRLKAVGLRPINNIVDVTNYVMLETGEPLHAFDIEQIKGNKIIVKKLPKGTKFITLDGIERELTGEDLMICNAEEGMCIAGVFGGLHSGISNNTKSLFLESANFNPGTIRKTSKHHNLSTDSAFRFERGADRNITVYAIKRAAMLIKEVAGGKITSDITDVYPKPVPNNRISISYDNINRIIGKEIEKNIIKTILECLGFEIIKEWHSLQTSASNGLEISIPSYKTDVTREVDVAEEILRIYGYNNIEILDAVRLSLNYSVKPDKDRIQNIVSDYLNNNGFYEIYCNSLTKEGHSLQTSASVKILNPVSKEVNAMRQTLLYGGLETIEYNQNRKQHDLKLYEFGNSYHLQNSEERRAKSEYNLGKRQQATDDRKALVTNERQQLSNYLEKMHLSLFMTGRKYNETWKTSDDKVDIYDMKYYLQNILSRCGIDLNKIEAKKINYEIFEQGLSYLINNEELLSFGLLNKSVTKSYDIKADVYYADVDWMKLISLSAQNVIHYEELPKYPEVRRDLALLIDKTVQYIDIEKAAKECVNTIYAQRRLLKKVDLFDVYEGQGIEKNQKSYAISFILQDKEKTLTDDEVDNIMNKIKDALVEQFNARIR